MRIISGDNLENLLFPEWFLSQGGVPLHEVLAVSKISRFIKDCLTGIDGETFDAWRFSAFFSLVSMVLISAYAAFKSQHFDAQSFGVGAAAILGGAAWGIRQKKDTEPSAKERNE